MLRNNGAYKIYIIQASNHKYNNGEWYKLNLDCVPRLDGFTASDECWQQTRIHGTFDLDIAMKALKKLRKWAKKDTEPSFKEDKFRIACVSISQFITPLSEK